MSVLTDERMKEIADILGEAYRKEQDAIGDTFTPGSMAFEINKLTSYTDGNIPSLGLLSGCEATANTNDIDITAGVVVYDNIQYNVDAINILITTTFTYNFGATCHYGFVIAIDKNDIATSSVSSRTKLDAALVANTSTYVEIADTSLLTGYTAPFLITVGGEEIEIWAVDSDNHALIAPHYNNGTAVSNHNDETVAFISKPIIPKIFFGLPVTATYQSGGNPATFAYYPPVSSADYIIICRGLATNNNTVTTPRTATVVAIEDLREFIDVYTPGLFTSLEIANIKSYANSAFYAASALANSQSAVNVASGLVEFTATETGYTFEDYWNNRPFVARSNYLRGESFYGVTRFEFSSNFKSLYYNTYGTELLSTFAIFRGDIHSGTQAFGEAPANLAGTYTPVLLPVNGNLSYGTWIYRVTAVTAYGETSPSVAVPVAIPESAGVLNKITLTWDAVAGALYYHVYRMGMSGVNYMEYKLTSDSEVLTNTYDDLGVVTGTAITRGIMFSGKTTNVAQQIAVYVPPVEGDFNLFYDGDLNSAFTNDTTIQNELIFNIYGIKTDGTIGGPHTVTIPKGTTRGTKFLAGSLSDLYIGIYDITFTPGTSLNLQGGAIQWSPYDLVVFQNI